MTVRIQRKRTKGWRMPEGAIYVGRGTKWGNPFVVGKPLGTLKDGPVYLITQADAVRLYRKHLSHWMWKASENSLYPGELAGKDLACWCPLDQPCHADVLLELANKPQPRDQLLGKTKQ